MDLLLYLIFTLLILAIFIYFLVRKLGIKEFRFNYKEGLMFIREEIPNLSVSLGNYIEIVVSRDGKMRKIHVNMIIKSNVDKIIDNFNLVLDKKIKFRIKQFYKENLNAGIRYPDINISLPLNSSEQPLNLKAEFETFDYTPFEISQGIHNLKLYYQTHNQRAVRKFRINFQETNKKSLELAKNEAINDRQAKVIRIPVVFI
ncbi:MAG: hypothetical protein ISS88_01040 [Candidatus Portnoybacteria bacterium]|nr:hypothetical protein [Candidatus Portnoybacteria bacterium]